MESRNLEKALKKLRRRRTIIGRQLDKAYLREDISLYIALEERYKRLAQIIERLLYRIRSKGDNMREIGGL